MAEEKKGMVLLINRNNFPIQIELSTQDKKKDIIRISPREKVLVFESQIKDIKLPIGLIVKKSME